MDKPYGQTPTGKTLMGMIIDCAATNGDLNAADLLITLRCRFPTCS